MDKMETKSECITFWILFIKKLRAARYSPYIVIKKINKKCCMYILNIYSEYFNYSKKVFNF